MSRFNKVEISIMMVATVFAALFVFQYRVNKSLTAVELPVQRSRQIAEEYVKLQSENQNNLDKIKELEEKIAIYEDENASEDKVLENLYSEIEKYKTLSGYTRLSGSGVVLKLYDPIDRSQSFITQHQDNILEIINVLNATETEAISINDQRYTSFTEIVPAGNHLEINGVSQGPPFEIKAIGNPVELENSLKLKGGILWNIKQVYGIEVELTRQEDMEISAYDKNIEYRYSELLK